MRKIENVNDAIGINYPERSGRYKRVVVSTEQQATCHRVALTGDSTIDNGHWVEPELDHNYQLKSSTVLHHLALALAKRPQVHNLELANFAVDGATTSDLPKDCRLNKVIPLDGDHPYQTVNQLKAVTDWQADTVVISVGGNNYREAMQGFLPRKLGGISSFLFKSTPDKAKQQIRQRFQDIQQTLLTEYKLYIDDLVKANPDTKRLVIMSQYYPAITPFGLYMIYNGFYHIGQSQVEVQTAFEAIEATMNELYRELLTHVATLDKEVIFLDVTSSMSPIAGNHTMQIEPNHRGAEILGNMMAEAINYQFPESPESHSKVAILRQGQEPNSIEVNLLTERTQEKIADFSVASIANFIRRDAYAQISLLFARSSTIYTRYESLWRVFVGEQFDTSYRGWPALGLLDFSLVTLIANYLWKEAFNPNNSVAVQNIAWGVAIPLLIAKWVVATACIIVCSAPLFLFHKLWYQPPQAKTEFGLSQIDDAQSLVVNLSSTHQYSITQTVDAFVRLCHQQSQHYFGGKVGWLDNGLNKAWVMMQYQTHYKSLIEPYRLGQIDTETFLEKLSDIFYFMQSLDKAERHQLLAQAWSSSIQLDDNSFQKYDHLIQMAKHKPVYLVSNTNELDANEIIKQLQQHYGSQMLAPIDISLSDSQQPVEIFPNVFLCLSYRYGAFKTSGLIDSLADELAAPIAVVSQYPADVKIAEEKGLTTCSPADFFEESAVSKIVYQS